MVSRVVCTTRHKYTLNDELELYRSMIYIIHTLHIHLYTHVDVLSLCYVVYVVGS